eukprot:3860894-Amphidinium_carterae.1
MSAKGLSSGEGKLFRAKIQRRCRMMRASQVSPRTGMRASLALCHGAPGGNRQSGSASMGGNSTAPVGTGAGQPSPLQTKVQSVNGKHSGCQQIAIPLRGMGRCRKLRKAPSTCSMYAGTGC